MTTIGVGGGGEGGGGDGTTRVGEGGEGVTANVYYKIFTS